MDPFWLAFIVVLTCRLTVQVKANSDRNIEEFVLRNLDPKIDINERLTQIGSFLDRERRLCADSKIVMKLEKLLAIKKALNEAKCTAKSYKLFENNLLEWSLKGPATLALIESAARRHTKSCLDELLELKSRKMQEMDQKELALVREYTDIVISGLKSDVIDERAYHGKVIQVDVDRFHAKDKEVLKMLDCQLAARKEQTGGGIADRLGYDHLLSAAHTYIIVPCEHYVEQTRKVFDLWKPLRMVLSSAASSSSSSSSLSFMTPEDEDKERSEPIRIDYHRFQICDYISGDKLSILSGRERLYEKLIARSSSSSSLK